MQRRKEYWSTVGDFVSDIPIVLHN